MFNPHEPRGPHGKWIREHGISLIHASDLSTPDARRSPEVSVSKFEEHARRGAAKMDALDKGSQTPRALRGSAWDGIVGKAFDATRSKWGGITVDGHSGKLVSDGLDAYALTMRDKGRESVHVSPNASRADFNAAMEQARSRFKNELRRPGAHLGVFRDEDTGNIDIDPVLVTSSLDDVHDIGAYTHAVGGAYHFKSGDGYWPPHVKNEEQSVTKSLSYVTPANHTDDLDLATDDGRLAFWKQILPLKRIHYTAKDGTRKQIDFTREYLNDLATNKAVDTLGFLLADGKNSHDVGPENWRGTVTQMEVRDDGLYGKIVFPSAEAAKAVIANPNLGVSARIRENIPKDDGSTLSRGILHVLGTMDPQATGMTPWQAADLSTEPGDLLDLSDEEYEDMPKTKPLADYTEDDIAAMTEEELDTFLETYASETDGYTEDEEEDEPTDSPTDSTKTVTKPAEKETVDASTPVNPTDIELANARANEALRRVAAAEWSAERSGYMSEGVPVAALDLAAPVLNRAVDMVIDLSNSGEDDVNVSEVVRGLLDTLKGTVDLSDEVGHASTFVPGDDDPDKELLDRWEAQS